MEYGRNLLVVLLIIAIGSMTTPAAGCPHEEPGYCSGDTCYRGSNGVILYEGQSIKSQNGQYELKMQFDGNLVLYCNDNFINWRSDTYGVAINSGLRFQYDGNLVLYKYALIPVWFSSVHMAPMPTSWSCKMMEI